MGFPGHPGWCWVRRLQVCRVAPGRAATACPGEGHIGDGISVPAKVSHTSVNAKDSGRLAASSDTWVDSRAPLRTNSASNPARLHKERHARRPHQRDR
jgi:hypothetical protein